MLTVALTGNIASGKSTVAEVWRDLGATVIEADDLARRAVEPGTPGLARIVERWGPAMLNEAGELDRARMRDLVFRDPAERRELEKIIHPEVSRLRWERLGSARASGLDLVVADIPLLFEAGLEDDFDRIVLVDAPEETRLDRLVNIRGLNRDEARRMLASQWPVERKRGSADYFVDNSGTLSELRDRAAAVWRELQRDAARTEEAV